MPDIENGKKEYHHNYYINNKDKFVGYYKKRYSEKRDEIIKYIKKYMLNNKEKVKKYKQEWYRKNKDKIINRIVKYNRSHPLMRNKIRAQRRLGMFINGKIDEKEWVKIKENFNSICAICGKSNVTLTIDHIIPLSKGGKHELNNIQPLCRSCNASKGNKIWQI